MFYCWNPANQLIKTIFSMKLAQSPHSVAIVEGDDPDPPSSTRSIPRPGLPTSSPRIADHNIIALGALLPWNWRRAISIDRAA